MGAVLYEGRRGGDTRVTAKMTPDHGGRAHTHTPRPSPSPAASRPRAPLRRRRCRVRRGAPPSSTRPRRASSRPPCFALVALMLLGAGRARATGEPLLLGLAQTTLGAAAGAAYGAGRAAVGAYENASYGA